MLQNLIINNIAVIENAEPTFDIGLNVLTGETGAGKSIIVDSINAVLGERTSKDIIRTGCDKAQVVAVFQDVSDYCKAVFLEYGIDDDNGQYIFQRTLSSQGKTTCRVNGIPVNTSVLKDLGKYLINIHGQHDNQLLLNPDNHILFLDSYAENSEVLNDYQTSFKRFKTVRKELLRLIEAHSSQQEQLELLKFQLKELEDADIKAGEMDSLKTSINAMENHEALSKALSGFIVTLSENEESSPVSKIKAGSADLSKLSTSFKEIEKLSDKFNALVYELTDVKLEAEKILDNFDFDPETLENSRNRLDFLYSLMRKYGNSEEKMLEYLEDCRVSLRDMEVTEGNIPQLEAELEIIQSELIKKAEVLSQSRTAAAKRLSQEVCDILKFLNMENVEFEVVNNQGNYNSLGTDRIEFYITANKGQQKMPLSKVASGGELSRIMLSIKSVLADKDNVDTLIFDEIDTGISGRAARKIGIQLKRVSKLRQVICITHLAQIAAIADNHMQIKKETREDNTYTSVETLTGDDRVYEVARIMSGSDITENLYKTAKELIESETAEE